VVLCEPIHTGKILSRAAIQNYVFEFLGHSKLSKNHTIANYKITKVFFVPLWKWAKLEIKMPRHEI